MKPSWEDSYRMPDEVDLKSLQRVPNPFKQTFRDLNLVSLDDDVRAAFPDSQSVNQALRGLIEKQQISLKEQTQAA